jgi:hypothetical protein
LTLLIKKELSWLDNTTQTFQLSKVRSLKYYLRNNILGILTMPLEAVAQTTIVNRLAYANYIEGRNIDVKILEFH